MGHCLDKLVFMHRGASQEVLPILLAETKRNEREPYDLVYIDGSHFAKDVMVDAVLAFEMLVDGGHIIFDDYEWSKRLGAPFIPKTAIDAFLSVYEGRIRVLHKDWQVIVEKIPIGQVCLQ